MASASTLPGFPRDYFCKWFDQQKSNMTTIYLSCTTEDLLEHKLAVKDRLDALRQRNINTLPHTVAEDRRPLEKCLTDVGECDIYIGIFAFRYGEIPNTPKNPKKLSFTELEYLHARSTGKTCLVFLATRDTVTLNLVEDGPDKENIDRLRREFEDTGSRPTPEYFNFNSKDDLITKIISALYKHNSLDTGPDAAWPSGRSPYPGLKPFDFDHAPVYFGRERQVQEVLEKLDVLSCSFLIVSGASGSGKSSLLKAGVLPKLTNSADGGFLYMRPGEDGSNSNPFTVLADEVCRLLPEKPRKIELARDLKSKSTNFASSLQSIDPMPRWLLLDQMEELFTLCPEYTREPFLESIFAATSSGLRVLASIRSDYLHHCQMFPRLHQVLEDRHYVDLWTLKGSSILDMIRKPAEVVGLETEEIADTLADDTEDRPGNLPLLAAALERLWQKREGVRLSSEVYNSFGGIHGVVGSKADEAFETLVEQIGISRSERAFHEVFSALVRVTIEGQPTRYVARIGDIPEGDAHYLIDCFSQEKVRLLVHEGEKGKGEATIQVSHEALFDAWPRLKTWIDDRRNDERELALAERDAEEWAAKGYDPLRIEPVKLLDARGAMLNLGRLPEQLSKKVRNYLYPVNILTEQLDEPLVNIDHRQRARIGDLLDTLGADHRSGIGVCRDGTPEGSAMSESGYWVDVSYSEDGIFDNTNIIEKSNIDYFHISRLPVTQGQFKAFIADADGYENPDFWFGLKRPPHPFVYLDNGDNRPVTSCDWSEAVAYCRWLTYRLKGSSVLEGGKVIRLPAEYEWQQAASGGCSENVWPWGAEWGEGPANTVESGIGHVCAVGLFPEGATAGGILDMAGNIWEWCLSGKVNNTDAVESSRVMRGGSSGYDRDYARVNFRRNLPNYRYPLIGFRLCLSFPWTADC